MWWSIMVDTIPTEPTAAPNAGNEPEPTQNEPVAEPKKLTFTQEELDRKFQERQTRGEKAAEKKFQKQISDLSAQIEEFKGKDLGEVEKLQNKVKTLTDAISNKDAELSGANLKLAKIDALLRADATPSQIPELLTFINFGTTPEEIEAAVSKAKDLGWIGKQPEPGPKPAGLGSPTKTGEPTNKPTLKDQIAELDAKIKDPKLSQRERGDLTKALITLNNKFMKGER
jgi:hypothetical protein